ncbi:hypothetical protein [Trujillonella humicola]|uniref:hypothetical protein n=1 Tax=Trujillonella humicola TaxID=3383699 RepID=UPI003905DB1E
MRTTLTRLVTVLALVGAVLLAPVSGDRPAGVAQAAPIQGFDAGNIISDAVFFDGTSMDAASVDRFLAVRGASCVAGEMPCLKDFAQTTVNQAPDAMCSGYQGAANESAGTIIAKVGRACGVSPRVLLVLLQKEQGLVTRTRPTTTQYQKATGFACPDTAPCDPAFSGFVSQVYFAARQFQRYRIEAARYGYKAGRVNTIQWNVPADCGTSQVYIANQATAGLYNYTPYRPNQASLDAYPGEGNRCSSYGNRNFYAHFVNWFGTTQSVGGNAIHDRYQQLGGATGPLGPSTDVSRCGLTGGGCYQLFRSGAIYWSPASGARVLVGAIWQTWGAQGWENGPLGYPTTDENCGLVDGGCWQGFQKGTMHWSHGTGAHAMLGAVRDKWGATGWEAGPLGYPTGGLWCGLTRGGCVQEFQRGAIYWAPATGARAVLNGPVRDRWGAQGWEGGSLGYPTADTRCGSSGSGCVQDFERGTIAWSTPTGARVVAGAVLARWTEGRREAGPLGFPTAEMWCGLSQGGCVQQFQQGAVYWSAATGARAVSGPVQQAWGAQGWETGPLGYPRREMHCDLVGGGCWQEFQNGALYWTAETGAHGVVGAIRQRWGAQGWETGALGYPTTGVYCGLVRGGCFQQYQGGSIYWSPGTGARVVSDPLRAYWGTRGWEAGALGYPVEEARVTADGQSQRFAGGTLVYSTLTGQVTQR